MHEVNDCRNANCSRNQYAAPVPNGVSTVIDADGVLIIVVGMIFAICCSLYEQQCVPGVESGSLQSPAERSFARRALSASTWRLISSKSAFNSLAASVGESLPMNQVANTAVR